MADWTDDRIAQLERLWATDLSTSQIASAMVCFSKNAIVGKAHRLHLPARPSPIKKASGNVAPPKRAPKLTLVVTDVVEVAPVVREPAKKPCCWPLGEPGTKAFRYCDDQIKPGKPYCAAHCRLAYVSFDGQRASA